MWTNFKSGFSSKDAQKVMDEANAPLDTSVQAQQPAPAAEQAPAAQPAPAAEQAPAAQPDAQQPVNPA